MTQPPLEERLAAAMFPDEPHKVPGAVLAIRAVMNAEVELTWREKNEALAAQAAEIAKLKEQVAWQRLLNRYVPIMFKTFVGHLQRGASVEGAIRAMNSDAATKLPYCPVDGDNIPMETPELRAALEAALAAGGKADE